MGICLCKEDDSTHDFKCEECKQLIGRNSDVFILKDECGDMIFCTRDCRKKFSFSFFGV